MATKPEDVKRNEDDYADAFNTDIPTTPEPTEDEAFGLGMDVEQAAAADAEQSSGDGAPLESVVLAEDAADAQADAAPEGAPADATADVTAEAMGGEGDDEPTDPKEIQRKKSWEGRLRKLEAELKAKADALAAGKPEGEQVPGSTVEEQASEALEQVADQAEAGGDAAMADKVEQVAEKVEGGEMSAEEAMKSLAEDFGEPFVKMIAAIAKSAAEATATAKVGMLESTTRDIIEDIKETKARTHFKSIESAHPDFVEIGADPAFVEWKGADPERERIASSGSADEINAMLTEFKSQGATTEPGADAGPAAMAAEAPAEVDVAQDDGAPDDELDAAEGVRSAGMQLPEEPAAADDYAGAWEEFAAKDRRA